MLLIKKKKKKVFSSGNLFWKHFFRNNFFLLVFPLINDAHNFLTLILVVRPEFFASVSAFSAYVDCGRWTLMNSSFKDELAYGIWPYELEKIQM